jgi:hypothetical protein
MQFVSILVCEYGFTMDDAWHCTPQEFWAIHDWKVGKNEMSNGGVPPMSLAEMEQLEKDLAHVST